MHKSTSIQLSIPEPCSQNWDEMTANETGHFCDSCKKSVYDFTNYNDQQLIDFFKRSKGNICGKIKSEQLNKSLYSAQQTNNHSIPKFLLSTALAIGLGNNAYSKGKHTNTTIIQTTLNEITEDKQSNPTIGSDSIDHISGTIIDQATKETLPGVTVFIEGTTIATSTDMNGFFKMGIPDSLQTDTITVIISCIGFETQKVKFIPGTFASNPTIEIKKDSSVVESLNGVVGGISSKRTLWNRIKYRWYRIKHKEWYN